MQVEKQKRKRKYKITVIVSCLIFLVPCGLVMFLYYLPKYSGDKISQTTVDFNTSSEPPNYCKMVDFVGDEVCDDEVNNELCDFDGGDCCDIKHDRSLCSECFCHSPKVNQDDCGNYAENCLSHIFWAIGSVGDGICHDHFNIKSCFFDGGDCCLEEKDMSKCNDCTCIPSNLVCVPQELGDGICQDYNNFEICDYDFGDCCTEEHLSIMFNNTVKKDCCECNCKHLLVNIAPQFI